MSSTGGSNLRGGGGVAQQILLEGGLVQTGDGSQFDLTTVEGVAQIKNVLNASELAELEGLMRAQGYTLEENRWVPSDSMQTRSERVAANEAKIALEGATDVSKGLTDLDIELRSVYADAGVVFPYNANTTSALHEATSHTRPFRDSVDAMSTVITNNVQSASTAPNTPVDIESQPQLRTDASNFVAKIQALEQAFPHGNIMELLYLVFRESIQETNEDKKYFLTKLQDFNKMAESLSDYLSELVEDSQRLSAEAEGMKYPEKATTKITTKKFDTSSLGPNGEARLLGAPATKTVDRAGLNDTIKDVESMQETVRNKRQMASTAFQNFDQKSNQLYNLMSSVMKVMGEMRSGTTRNML